MTTIPKSLKESAWLPILVVLGLFIAAYWYETSTPETAAPVAVSTETVRSETPSESSEAIKKLQQEIYEHAKAASWLEERVELLEELRRRNDRSRAVFDPAEDSAYQRVDTYLGPMLLILHDVAPFADGSRVTIRIGNITSAIVSGAKLHIDWAPKMPVAPREGASQEVLSEYNRALASWSQANFSKDYSKDFDVLTPLRPGTWTVAKVNLPKVTPAQLGSVGVRLTTDQVALAPP